MQPNVGEKVRTLREKRNLSLRALAQKCGLSFNAISRIERGESSHTVATLHQLARALYVPITAFFENDNEQKIVLVRRNHGQRSNSDGVTMESLGVGLRDQQTEPFLVTLEVGAGDPTEMMVHSGEEFVHCLAGVIMYHINDNSYRLEAGDSLLFEATQPHCFYNLGEVPAQFLLVFQGIESRHSHF